MRARAADRWPGIDALRGVGVVLMIVWHTSDGWLAPEYRTGSMWNALRVLGGLAAPIFLVTAGAVASSRMAQGTPALEIARRGVQLILIGIALRLVLWLTDGGAILRPNALLPALLIALGCGLGLRARERRWELGGAMMLITIGIAVTDAYGRAFVAKVDVLHAIGAGLIACACLHRAPRWTHAVLAIAVCTLTPSLGELARHVPLVGAWIARNRANAALAGFPLAPWLAYVLAGAAVRELPRGRAALIWIAAASALAVLVAYEGSPIARAFLGSHPEWRTLSRLAFHLGAVGLMASSTNALVWLAPLGRASLPIYCVHLELAFGLLALPIAERLDPRATAIGIALVLILAHHGARLWNARRRGGPSAHTRPELEDAIQQRRSDSFANSRS